MSNYIGQHERGNPLGKLDGEDPALLFTESDRRKAYILLHNPEVGYTVDPAEVAARFRSMEATSHQAAFLLNRLIEAGVVPAEPAPELADEQRPAEFANGLTTDPAVTGEAVAEADSPPAITEVPAL